MRHVQAVRASSARRAARAPGTSEGELNVGGGLTIWMVIRGAPMADFLAYALVPLAVGVVAIVLLLGLVNMMRGGSPQTSQKLMRLRVLMQFIAIIVIMVTVWAMQG